MKLARFLNEQGQPGFGEVDDGSILELQGSMFGESERSGKVLSLEAVSLLPPVRPGKIVCIGSNYRRHIEEMNRPVPTEPKLFLKPPSTVIGPGTHIEIPTTSDRVEHEAELAVVVGRTLRHCDPASVLDGVLGYTCVNDVTARDLQKRDGVFTRAKGFDTFCPMGPWITTALDSRDLLIRSWVNDELRQDGRTSEMIFGVAELLSFISGIMTLFPGDLVSTGTPAGVGPLREGDRVRVQVEDIGDLENPVRNSSRE
ncbi:MAG: fumarylacetoacetate hydrolase family protein [Myxococcota bacterium]|jgi:2-keto-4-pentenoate hydratase/2-oxohepta-3-ene-1,7-dioic acid hydratase in catechol pathway|nr:fumarylacetoacetate hydrolase family protein [Myxococcota bacterium]